MWPPRYANQDGILIGCLNRSGTGRILVRTGSGPDTKAWTDVPNEAPFQSDFLNKGCQVTKMFYWAVLFMWIF